MAIQGPKQKRYIVLDTNDQDYIMIGTYDEIQAEFNNYHYTFLDPDLKLEIYELGELQEIKLTHPAMSFMSVTEKLKEIYNETHKIKQLWKIVSIASLLIVGMPQLVRLITFFVITHYYVTDIGIKLINLIILYQESIAHYQIDLKN